MKVHIVTVVTLAFAAACLAVPRNKKQAYDEPRLSNEVIPGTVEGADETSAEVITTTDKTEDSSTQVDTTKTPALDDAPTPRPGNKKKRPNSSAPASDTFSRVIDDIFNIPISVLRAVNTLISNAFGTKQTAASPDVASASIPA